MDKLIAFVFCLVCSVGVVCANNKLIVVLVDGLRWDYINDPKLKGIPRIIKNGVRAPYVVPVFPSMSFPNYQSIATGMYPENHGFLANTLYLNDSGSFFPSSGSSDPVWWNEAEPIWVSAERQGKPAAVYWWAGCEVEISGTHPTVCERQRYGPADPVETLDFLERVDDIVQMFKPSRRSPKDRLSLAMLYYGAVDYEGHYSGPNNSPGLKEALYDIDDILDKMQSKIKKAGLQDEVNILVVGDHGMTEVIEKKTKHISLEKFSPKIKYQLDSGSQSMLMPMPGMIDQLYDDIKNEKIEGILVYKKENIPEKYHVRQSDRMFPLYIIAKNGYVINTLKDSEKTFGRSPSNSTWSGSHGYDPEENEDMLTAFFATGPDFRKGFKTDVLHNVDFYNVMCNVLKISPMPNNGSFERVKPMLVNNGKSPLIWTSSAAVKSGSFCICLLMCAINLSFIYHLF